MRNSPPEGENQLLGPILPQYPPKHVVIQVLIARFGSRRGVIEELDRLSRLRLLTPAQRDTKDVGSRNGYPRIKNEPNPQWRELKTPSLLISGEIIPEKTELLSATPPKRVKKKISPKTVKNQQISPNPVKKAKNGRKR